MKILFLAPRLPLPSDTGGKIRTMNLLRQIAKKNEVYLICFSFETTDNEYVRELARMNIVTTLIPMKEDSIMDKVMGMMLSQYPYSITKYYSQNMESVIVALAQTNKFDLIHFDHLHMAHYRNCFNGFPSVLDEHNVEYLILERCAKLENSPIRKVLFDNQARKMKIFEARKINQFSCCLAVSSEDRELLSRLGQGKVKVEVIPNGVDTEFFKPLATGPLLPAPSAQDQVSGEEKRRARHEERGTNEGSLVFTGSLDWWPNEDAVLYFCKAILPLIWKKKKQIKFTVVGKAPTPAVQKLASKDKRIIVTGRVDDVRPLMGHAKIFVVPIRVGGGTRLKILEAMAMSKAVVSTSMGAEGISYTEGKDIVIADKAQDFADKVVGLLENPSQMASMGEMGRRLVCQQYDWNIIGEKLLNIYEKTIQQR